MDEWLRLFLEKISSTHNRILHVLEKLIAENVCWCSFCSDSLLDISKRSQWNKTLITLRHEKISVYYQIMLVNCFYISDTIHHKIAVSSFINSRENKLKKDEIKTWILLLKLSYLCREIETVIRWFVCFLFLKWNCVWIISRYPSVYGTRNNR